MDSQEKSIQFLGRLVRKDESKSKVYLDDLHYPGNYLSRHGNHRRKYYQDQGLKVIRLSKLWDKYLDISLFRIIISDYEYILFSVGGKVYYMLR